MMEDQASAASNVGGSCGGPIGAISGGDVSCHGEGTQNGHIVSLQRQVTAGDKTDSSSMGTDAYRTSNGGNSGPAAAAVVTPGAVTTEQLALIGFTARLGATVTNADAEDTATREEARLLLSLLGKKYDDDGSVAGNRARLCSDDTADGSLPCSDGSSSSSRGSRSASPEQMDGFSLSCPSLSIEPTRTGHVAARPYMSPIPQKHKFVEDAGAALSPAELFRRPLTIGGGGENKQGTNDMAKSSEAVATNVMRSFGSAAEWRGRAWMQSLGDVLSLREKSAAGGRGERLRGEFEAELSGEGGGGEITSPSISNSSGAATPNSEAGDGSSNQGDEEGEEVVSNELKVIYALARSVSRIQIKSVRTSFRVQAHTPQQASHGCFSPAGAGVDQDGFVLFAPEKPFGNGRTGTPPPKKRRFRQVSASPTNTQQAQIDNIEGRKIPTINGKYNVQHKLAFEATLRVALPQENGLQQEQEVVLSAPGTVRGTFREAPRDGEGSRAPSPEQGAEVLCGVEVKLDTDVLALSVERFSRMIVRRAAEADMLACAAEAKAAAEEVAAAAEQQQQGYQDAQQGVVSSQQEYAAYEQDPRVAQYYGAAAPPTEQSADYPPVAYASPPGSHPSSSSGGAISDEIAMGPPASMTAQDHHPHTASYLFSPGTAGTISTGGAVSFVSPSPTATAGVADVNFQASDLPYAPNPEEHGDDGYYGSGQAAALPAPRPRAGSTSLPALLEVACAAMQEG